MEIETTTNLVLHLLSIYTAHRADYKRVKNKKLKRDMGQFCRGYIKAIVDIGNRLYELEDKFIDVNSLLKVNK